MQSESYGNFAKYYDILMADADHKGIAEHIDGIIMKNRGKRGILLDLACGTGTMCELFAKMGYDVIGTDISQQMLSAALDKKLESGLPIQYLCQDMRELDMFGTIDAAVCTFDSLNHLETADDIAEVFAKVSLFCEPGGVFVFDMNTVFKHREILGNKTFVYDCGEVYCVWQNFLNEDDSVDIRLDFFENRGGAYYRSWEEFSEICLPAEQVKKMLEDSGFEVLGVYDGYTDRPLKETSERAVFVARKI